MLGRCSARTLSLEPIAPICEPPARDANGNHRCQRPPQWKREIGDQTQEGKGDPEDLSLHHPQSHENNAPTHVYREARREVFSQTVARLQQASGAAAVSTLLKIMVDPKAPASTRVRAADSILNHTKHAIEIEDIQARVEHLEWAAKEE
ncbi:MAG: hypothetical protein WAN65_20500 [Candidatus Sulfotelmatobacter sp.]